VPFGKGTLVFNQFRIFDNLGKNALADHMFHNLITAAKKADITSVVM